MRAKTFAVPVDSIVEFAEIVENHEMGNSIIGSTEDEEVLVKIEYEKDDRTGVFEIMELLEADEPYEEDE